jgi:hypothetical protein
MAAARARGSGSATTAKPRSDAYTGMLILSLVAMLGAIGLLVFDYMQYPDGKPPQAPKGLSAPAGPPAGGGVGGGVGAGGNVGAGGGAGGVAPGGAGGGAAGVP